MVGPVGHSIWEQFNVCSLFSVCQLLLVICFEFFPLRLSRLPSVDRKASSVVTQPSQLFVGEVVVQPLIEEESGL